MSSLTLAELRHGADLRRSRKLSRLIDAFAGSVTVADFDRAAAERYGVVGALLSRRGAPIGTVDTLIAAHALTLGLTLVTHNEKHVTRVPGLKVESWL